MARVDSGPGGQGNAVPVRYPVRDGALDGLLRLPDTAGPWPAVVLGAEATGINAFALRVADRLADLGVATLVPDYFRGDAPPDPEDYEDVDTIMAHVGRLDFRLAADDLVHGLRWLRARPDVRPGATATWGYCTGATLAWLAACLDGLVAGTVLFYPSQPVFEVLGPATPAHPLDLVWLLRCPSLFLYGDEDVVLPADRRRHLADELATWGPRWGVEHRLEVYPGAGHVFCGHFHDSYRPQADAASWELATRFVARHLGAGAATP